MDHNTTIAELLDDVEQTCMLRGWGRDERGIAVSIAVEAGELLEHFQWEDFSRRSDQEKIRLELMLSTYEPLTIHRWIQRIIRMSPGILSRSAASTKRRGIKKVSGKI